MHRKIPLLLFLSLLSGAAFAHEGEDHPTSVEDIAHTAGLPQEVLTGVVMIAVIIAVIVLWKLARSR